MWKVWRYQPVILLQAYSQLSKWNRLINQTDYQHWKHHLASHPNPNCTNLSYQQLVYLNKHVMAVARHHPKPMNCLRRCFALKALIEQRGGMCDMHIGVKIEEDGQVAAHSWISANGQLINDSEQEIKQYKEITHNNALFAKATIQN